MKLLKWLLAVAVLGYVLSPADLIPDVVPLVGWLDDIGALTLLGSALVASLRKERAQGQVGPQLTSGAS